MKYANVKNAHIVPRSYLVNFAEDEMIGVRLVREKRSLVQSVDKVGTRKHYYRRKRPTGEDIDDIEWSLSMLESEAAPVLRSFEERWPLDDDDKSKLAHLFAYQLLRGPRYKAEYEGHSQRVLDEFRQREDVQSMTPDELAKFEEAVTGSRGCS